MISSYLGAEEVAAVRPRCFCERGRVLKKLEVDLIAAPHLPLLWKQEVEHRAGIMARRRMRLNRLKLSCEFRVLARGKTKLSSGLAGSSHGHK